MERLCLR